MTPVLHTISRRVFLFILLAAVSAETLAQSPPERERGFKPDLVYQFNGIDSVSLFNGNPNVTIPIATYPVSADVSYSFSLRYSGNLWHDFEFCQPQNKGPSDGCGPRWLPKVDNAGMGWRMSLGELEQSKFLVSTTPQAHWQYISSDGAEHHFYKVMHEPMCATAGSTNCDLHTEGTWYTRDGSYLRVKEKRNEQSSREVKIVEFPGGQRQLFLKYGDGDAAKWRLQYIYGASSLFDNDGLKPTTNYVKIDYEARVETRGSVYDWFISDSHGRSHKVTFRSGGHAIDGVVQRMDLQAFGGAIATYDFTYDNQPANDDPSSIAVPYIGGAMKQVRLLRQVEFPSGEKWQFQYHEPTGEVATPFSGAMKKIILPTLGSINWAYRTNPSWSINGVGEPTIGVEERWLEDKDNKKVEYTKYVMTDAEPEKTVVDTLIPVGQEQEWRPDSRVVHYFNRQYGPEFGLPYTAAPCGTTTWTCDGTAKNRKLSSETFDCNPAANTCNTTPERRQYVKYEMDAAPPATACSINYSCARDRNQRVVSERTVYVTDGELYADTDREEFDGLGHYRKTITGGSFSSGNERTSLTGFNLNTRAYNAATGGSSVGIYSLTADAPGGARAVGYNMLMDGDSWILNTYTKSETTEGGITAHTEACFDPTTGFLQGQRTKLRQDGTNSATDLLALYTRDPDTGFASREESFGGDVLSAAGIGLPTETALCAIDPARDARAFRIDYTTEFGALKTKQFFDFTTQEPTQFFIVDHSGGTAALPAVDKYTGLVRESKDTAGLKTTYSYDTSGRVKTITPPGMDMTEYTYTNASGSTPASVLAVTGTGTNSKRMEWEFDAFGRISVEKRRMPDGTWSGRKTTYDHAGRRESVSEQAKISGTTFEPVNKTTYTGYDPFGRVGTIRSPDGNETTFTYAGDRLTTRTYEVATKEGLKKVSVEEERDRAGRLITVMEDTTSATLNTKGTTRYTYDVGNRLTTVTMGTQPSRRFTYDRRGLLTSEWHPESNETSYTYDALGHVITKTTPAATLTSAYDRAGRVMSVDEGSLPLLRYTYDSTIFGHARGKVVSAKRYNRSSELGTVEVTEKFTYGDSAGRVTNKETTIENLPPATQETYTFSESYTYDSLGDLEKIGYPKCTGCSLTGPARTVTNTYSDGFVTAVGPYTHGAITYWPNGLIRTIRRQNFDSSAGPLYTQMIAKDMPRPDSIVVSEVCSIPDATITAESTITASKTQTASVPETAGAIYIWTIGGGTIVSGQGTREITFRAGCSGTVSFSVVVRTTCSATDTHSIVIVQPAATVSGSATIAQEQSTDIRVDLAGVGPWTINWSDSSSPQSVPGSPATAWYRVTPQGTKTYTINSLTDGYGCPGVPSGSATVTVIPPAPTNVRAWAVSPTLVKLTWSFAGFADRFEIYRDGGHRGTSPSTQLYFDDPAEPAKAYVYTVQAVKSETASNASLPDLATTIVFEDDPAVAKTTLIRAKHITELQAAVNVVRGRAGLLPVAFPSVAKGWLVEAAHLQAIRTALGDALSQLNLAPVAYTRPSVSQGMEIKAYDLNETRGGVQ